MTIIPSILIVFICMFEVNAHKTRKSHRHDPRIGIVGGGASGLYLAYKLNSEYGWNDNIFIYEKESLPSESAKTMNINDKLKDVGTVYVPRASFDILSINDETGDYELDYYNTFNNYQSLIDKYELTFSERAIYALDIDSQEILPNPLAFLFDKGYDINDMIQETIQVLLYYKDIKLVKFNKNDGLGLNYNDYIDNSLTYNGETLFEWGQRLNLPIMAYYQSWITDIVATAGPSLYECNAYFVLSIGEQFFIPFFQKVLLGLGITKEYFDNDMFDPFLYDIMNDPLIASQPYYIINEGFQTLWDRLSNELSESNVNIEYSTRVNKVSKSVGDKNKISLTFDDHEEEYFDYVFIACRTDDILSVLDENDFIKESNLFKYETRYVPYIATAVFNITNKIPQWFIDDNLLIGPYAIYPVVTLYGGTNEVENMYNCSVFYTAIYEEYKSIALWGFTDDIISDGNDKDDYLQYCINQFMNQLQNDFDVIDVTNNDIIDSEIWSIAAQPTVIAASNDYYENVAEIQGENNLFFIGEPVAGYTIPLVMQYIENNYKIFYDKMKK